MSLDNHKEPQEAEDSFIKLIGDATEQDTSKLEAHYIELAERLRKEMQGNIDEAFSAVIGEYLPFVATDLYANLFTKYGYWLTSDWSRVGTEFGQRTAKELRQKILQEHKDVLIKELDQDNLKRIEDLEETLRREREIRNY